MKVRFKTIKTLGIIVISFFIAGRLNGQTPTISSFTPTSGPRAALVSITGTNFIGTTAVSFGNTPASLFSVNSPNSITAFVGTGSSGNVMVTNASGSGIRSGFIFIPPPIINSFSPTTGALGTTVVIHGANFTNATGVYFGSVSANSIIVNSDTTITAVVGPGSSGTVTVTNPAGSGSLSGFTHTGPAINSCSPTVGIGGTQITLTGINFTGTTNVTINNIPVQSFAVVSPDTITAILASAAAGTIQVTTPNGVGNFSRFNQTAIASFTPFGGSIGTSITIKGFNFTGATNVVFGNVNAASFNITGDTAITAIVGSGETGRIKVTTPLGTDTSAFSFGFIIPIPQIYGFSPQIAGPGTLITINGKYFTGTDAVSFGDTPANSFTVISDSVLTALVTTGSSGSLNIHNPYGNSSGSPVSRGFIFTTLPTITSFAPTKGQIGSIVKIDGVNFGATPAANIVFFGAVKASVIKASSTSLTITVPAGAGLNNFTLSTGNLTTSTVMPFITAFPGDTSFTATSFVPRVDFVTGYLPYSAAAGDFDGDGKPDLVIPNYGDDNVSVLRNTGSNGVVSFASRVDFTVATGPRRISIYDMDGDGKVDIAVACQGGISVLRNTSTPGNISFAAFFSTSTGPGNQDITVADFDRDGKLDIAVANSDNFKFTVFKNNSTPGNISFAPVVDYSSSHPIRLESADLDGDGKPEVIITNTGDASTPPGYLTILKNTSSIGSITFAVSNLVFSNVNFDDVIAADFDGDLKPDVAIVDVARRKINILRNLSNASTIAFAAPVSFAMGNAVELKSADMNGDGKPDLVTSYGQVFKNNSTTGNISFSPFIDYTGDIGLCLNDMDMDGKPDIIIANLFSRSVSVLRNKVGPGLLQFCPPVANASLQSNSSGGTYQWQLDDGTGFTSITDNANYAGTTTAVLQLISIPFSWYGYKYRCLVDGINFSDTTEIRFRNIWTGVVSADWENPGNWGCSLMPDKYTDVIIPFGSINLNSNVEIRTLTLNPDAHINIAAGYNIKINH